MDPELLNYIKTYREKYGLPMGLLQSMALIESRGQHGRTSPKGAIGAFQITPRTAAYLNIDPSNMEQNTEGAARYMRELLNKNSGDVDLALASYNAGPSRVRRYGGVPPIPETQNYVAGVRDAMKWLDN
jgi:soluble lytic murein transglycosylase-like protein